MSRGTKPPTPLSPQDLTTLAPLASEDVVHLPLVFDVSTLFTLGAALEPDEPVILDAAMCPGRVCLAGDGWSMVNATAGGDSGQMFQVITAKNASGEQRQLWVEHGIDVRLPNVENPPPQSLHGVGFASAPEEQPTAFLDDFSLYSSAQDTGMAQSPTGAVELDCSDTLALDANLLALLAPEGVLLRGEGVLQISHVEGLVSGQCVEREGITFTEYMGKSSQGDMVSLLIQQGIVLS